MDERLTAAEVFDTYVLRIIEAESKDDLDLVMESVIEDDKVPTFDFVRLCFFSVAALKKL